jgi:HAD superfamily hydrolase (TIGR01549 family)
MVGVKAVLFDLDDTLFDTHLAVLHGLAALQSKYPVLRGGTPESLAKELREVGQATRASVMEKETSEVEIAQEMFRGLFAARGQEISTAQARRIAGYYHRAYLESQCAVAGAAELARRLHEFAVVGVVTNTRYRKGQEIKLRGCGLGGSVDFLVTSEETGEPKPGRKIFDAALAKAGCRADEAVMIGDRWETDVLGAVGAGIRAVWFNRRNLSCPEPSFAAELRSFEPVDAALDAVLRGTPLATY